MKIKETTVSASVAKTIQSEPYSPLKLEGFASVTLEVEEEGDASDVQRIIQNEMGKLWNTVGNQVVTQLKVFDD